MAQPTRLMSQSAGGYGYDPDQVEFEKLQRRRRVAEQMAVQAGQPLGDTQAIGGWAVKRSPLEGVAKVAQAYAAKAEGDQIDTEAKQLGERRNSDMMSTIDEYQRLRTGTPARTVDPATPNDDEGNVNPTVNMPATPGDPRAAIASLLASRNPMLQQYGLQLMTKENTPIKLGEGEKLLDPTTFKPLASGGGKGFSLSPNQVRYDADGKPIVSAPVKLDLQNTGGAIQAFDPMTGAPVGAATPTTMRPGEAATLAQRQYEWNNISPVERVRLQNEAARIGISAQELFFNTGIQAGGGARVPGNGVAVPSSGLIGRPAAGPSLGGQPQAPAPPVMQGRVTPKALAEREAQRPHSEQSLRNVSMNIDSSVKQIDDLLKAPGLSNITGPVYGRTPNITGDATNAQAKLDTLKAQIGVEVLTAMREASKTGGAVGNVTEKEWPILQNQLGALQQAQTTAEFRKGLSEVKARLLAIKQNAQGAFESSYGNPQRRSGDRQQIIQPQGMSAADVMSQADSILGIR